MISKPIVSICCITFNHVDYIRQCIEGFLLQKTDFLVEILIFDDASTDGTQDIIKEYAKDNSNIITFLQKENQWSKKKYGLTDWLFPISKGKYIALCEGDDYWTDPLKLQKQVDFLEVNPDYGICFHNVTELNTFNVSKNKLIPNVGVDLDYSLDDYIMNNRTATCSIIFKKAYLSFIPKWFYKVPFGDLAVIIAVMYNSNKKGHVLKDNMAVYRIHENGIHGSFHKNNKSLINAYLQHILFTKIISKEFLVERKFRKTILKKKLKTYEVLSTLYNRENDKWSFLKANILMKYYKLKIKFF